MHRLTFRQSSHIVQACIESQSLPTVALYAAAGLCLSLQKQNVLALLAEDMATDESAES